MHYQIPWQENIAAYAGAATWVEQWGYTFTRQELLYEALTHRSAVKELADTAGDEGDTPWNERLEFLGDAVLNFVIADLLFKKFPEWNEGTLSKRRAALVSAYPLAQYGLKIGLQDYLVVGAGMKDSDRFRVNLLADAIEAIIGAIYLDGGEPAARKWIENLWLYDVENETVDEQTVDFKTKLQEAVQEVFRSTPTYDIVHQTGPAHSRTFIAHVIIEGALLGQGIGESKKLATQQAASQAWKAWPKFLEEKRGRK